MAVHLVTDYLDRGLDPAQAAIAAARRLTGAYALAMIFKGEESLVIGARKGSPLAVGYGDGRGLSGFGRLRARAVHQPHCLSRRRRRGGAARRAMSTIYDAEGRLANREMKIATASAGLVDKGGYRHFMAKEIHEQPEVIAHTHRALSGSVGAVRGAARAARRGSA